jgi:hypothetical protein
MKRLGDFRDRVIKPMNPDAVNYLSWFMSDATNLRNWATAIFAADVDIESTRFAELRDAVEKTILEIQDDITKIKEYLDTYKQ